MNQRSRKFFLVALALFAGVGVIFFAWQTDTLKENRVASFEPTVSSGSWKDSLLAVPQKFSIKSSDSSQDDTDVKITTTDIIARELLVNYARIQQNSATTTLSDADAKTLAEILVGEIDAPHTKTYTIENVLVSSENNDVALAVYTKKVKDIMQVFSSTHATNELVVVADALTTKDESRLQGLVAIGAQYKDLQKKLLAVPTPSKIAPLHLRLVQSYANIETSIEGMQKMISDPVVGLASFTQYKKESDILRAIDVEYQNYESFQ